MVNNAPAARPQSGLSAADIIIEVLAEGGITRFIAIFQSEGGAESVGPIRSIRPYLIELGESYDGVLIHAGGSPEAYSILQNSRNSTWMRFRMAALISGVQKIAKPLTIYIRLWTSSEKVRTKRVQS